MNVDGEAVRTVWPGDDGRSAVLVDQTLLPHQFELVTVRSVDVMAHAIETMKVRGAPAIGVAAGLGLALAAQADVAETTAAAQQLRATRPTAVNLDWAVRQVEEAIEGAASPDERAAAAWTRACELAAEDVARCEAIGRHGLGVLEPLVSPDRPLNVLTHCNAGWLAAVDWGTALAPVYAANRAGIDVHVWVDETRPRNQGASLTAWELGHEGVAHTVIADNAGGHLMQHGEVDVCLVGSDRTTAAGDVGNKIGTYLKALAANANEVPFYAVLPTSTIDWDISDGLAEIPIEERSPDEVTHLRGVTDRGEVERVRVTPPGSPAANPAFDVTPSELVTGIVTERGVAEATAEGLAGIRPEDS